MRQRPIACLALLVFLFLWLIPVKVFYEPLQVTKKCEVQVTGRVSRRTEKNEKTQIYLQNCQVKNKEVEFEAKQLLVYLADTADYPVGTDLSLSGTIYPIEEPTNPGQFNSRLYYHGKGIAYTVYAENAKVLSVHTFPVREKLLLWKERLALVYEQVLNDRDSGLLQAMVLGAKENLDADTKELYQKNGISHLLAISGLHISLVGMGLYQILKKLTGSCIPAGVLVVLFLWGYGWMTGASISAVRAVMMCSLAILADLIGRTYDMLTAVGAAALVFMLTDPLSARQSAFLLSFGAVLAIALIQPLWNLYLSRPGRLVQSVSVSLSVLMITFPLLLCFFFEYPLYSTLLNLLVIPLMSVLMVCGILCGFVGLISLSAAKACGILCHLILNLYEWMGERCLSMPGAVLTIGSPAGWKVVLYYIFLTAGLVLLYREKRRKKYWRKTELFRPGKGVLAGSLCLFFVGICLLCLRVHTGLDITMLDVGQGDAIFFQSPSGTTFLCDGGSTNVKGVGSYRILPFLQSEGVGTLDYILISHMDQDHISGLCELAEDSQSSGDIRIGCAVLPDLASKDEAYLEMEQLLTDAGIRILHMGRGDRLSEEKFSITCLWPGREEVSKDRNDLSLVFLAEYGEFQMLFTGDIGESTEKKLVSLGLPEELEVLKVPHHGSRYSSSETFLEQFHPVISLVSCSASNRYGHPGAETLERLENAGSRIWITKDSGAIRLKTDGRKVWVKEFVE